MKFDSQNAIALPQSGHSGEEFIRLHGDAVTIDWFPESAVAHMRLQCESIELEHAQILHRLQSIIADRQEPYYILIDLSGVAWASLAARESAEVAFSRSHGNLQLWAYGLNSITYVIAKMFFRFTGLKGGIAANLDEARSACGLTTWQPAPLECHSP